MHDCKYVCARPVVDLSNFRCSLFFAGPSFGMLILRNLFFFPVTSHLVVGSYVLGYVEQLDARVSTAFILCIMPRVPVVIQMLVANISWLRNSLFLC